MGRHGNNLARLQLAMITAIVTIRLIQGLRPLNYIPLAIFVFTCGGTIFSTPTRTDPYWDTGLRGELINVLNRLRNQEATVLKDKVYALYGLLEQLEIDLPKPIYTNEYSLEDTYLDFTHSIMKWQGSLDILREVSGVWSPYAPSWVPDFRRKYERHRLPAAEVNPRTSSPGRSYIFSEDLCELTTFFRPLGKITSSLEMIRIPPQVVDGEGTSCLSTDPLLEYCENIKNIRNWLRAAIGQFRIPVDIIHQFLDSISTWQETYTDDERHAWANNLLSDHLAIPRPNIERFMGVPVSASRGRRIIDQFRSQDLHSPGLQWRILLVLATSQRLWRLHRRICRMLAETMTFIVAETIDGEHFLGMGPTSCQSCDSLVLLPTLKTPMDVRAVADSDHTYQLMGAVHLPGLKVDHISLSDDRQLDYIRVV